MKRTFSCHFWLLFQSKSRLSLLMTFFESRISMKMKRTFSCNFGFAFTAKVKLSLLVVFKSIKRIATVFKAKCVYRMLLPFGRFCTELACPCQLSYVCTFEMNVGSSVFQPFPSRFKNLELFFKVGAFHEKSIFSQTL